MIHFFMDIFVTIFLCHAKEDLKAIGTERVIKWEISVPEILNNLGQSKLVTCDHMRLNDIEKYYQSQDLAVIIVISEGQTIIVLHEIESGASWMPLLEILSPSFGDEIRLWMCIHFRPRMDKPLLPIIAETSMSDWELDTYILRTRNLIKARTDNRLFLFNHDIQAPGRSLGRANNELFITNWS